MSPRDDAEKATLGAILNDPSRLAELSDWLAPEDFYSPQHQAIYRAMLILDKRDAIPDLNPASYDRVQNLTAYLLKLANHVNENGTRLDVTYLHTLMHACPRPENAPHYARMVVEADTHRTIIENATRLAQVAQTQQQTSSPWMEDLFVHTAAFRQVLNNLAERWGINPEDFDDPTTTPAARETAEEAIRQGANAGSTGFADQLAPELDIPPTPDQRAAAIEREDTVLACILRNPDQIDEIRDFLEPEDFTTPDRAAYYEAALNLHDRGEPIDPITLTWEARRHSTPAGPSDEQAKQNETAPLTYERLTNMWNNGLPADVAPYHARQVLENAIRMTTTQAARDLKNLAANPCITPVDLLTAAAHRIDQTVCQETRWNTSHPAEPRPNEPTDRQAGTGRSL